MRREESEFPRRTVDLMQTFANQSVLAIQNARLFREIEEKSRQLEIASQHKSQFLANMSHELRTPLNAVLGYTEMLLDGVYGDVADEAQEILQYIQSNGEHLLALINDVLDLSKIEAGQLTLAIDEYALEASIEAVVAVAQPLARPKGLDLKVSVARDLPIGRGDERRLTQVLLNLVGNAIKFTDAGSVEISAGASGANFEVGVVDTGPGDRRFRPGADLRRLPAGRQFLDTRERGDGPRPRDLEAHRPDARRNDCGGIGAGMRFHVPDRRPGACGYLHGGRLMNQVHRPSQGCRRRADRAASRGGAR